jgi:hypothetical protein
MSIYAWSEVVRWIRDVIRIEPDEGIDYLDRRQQAQLDAEITAMTDGSVARTRRSALRPVSRPRTA